jgi:hypothetical protein
MKLTLKPNDRYILCKDTKTNEDGIYDLKEKVFIKINLNSNKDESIDFEYIISSETKRINI